MAWESGAAAGGYDTGTGGSGGGAGLEGPVLEYAGLAGERERSHLGCTGEGGCGDAECRRFGGCESTELGRLKVVFGGLAEWMGLNEGNTAANAGPKTWISIFSKEL